VLFILTYLVFFLYPIEIMFNVTVLQTTWLDALVKGTIFTLFEIQIVLKFRVSFDLRGKEITDRKLIKENYIRNIWNGRFFWDFFSLLGLLIDTFSINFPYKWVTYLLFYTKIYFVLEFDTFIQAFLRLKGKLLGCYKLMRLYLIILFTCNITACLFYYIGE